MSNPPPKSWWSLSKASSAKGAYSEAKLYSRRSSNIPKPSSGFKSIAEAIGLKSKKQARDSTCQTTNGYSLSPVATEPLTTPTPLPNSPVESVEPLTPIDSRRLGGHSLLTLGDGPFTVRLPIVQVRQSPVPSRSSAYSNASATDLLSRKADSPVYHTSASSSTNSHSPALDASSMVVSISPRGLPESKKIRLKRSVGSMQVTMPDHHSRQASFTSTVLNSNLTGIDPSPPRPKLRSRGMTDGGLPQKAGFFVKEPMIFRKLTTASNALPATTPEAIPKPRKGRQTAARIHAPPSAPPTSSLPATPPVEQPDPRQRIGLDPHPVSPLSLPISMVNGYPTTLNPIHDAKQISQPDLRSPEESIPESVEYSVQDSKTPPSSPRVLKKASSQRSLIRGTSPASSVRTATCPEQSSDKRTQRNHHSRLPLSTIPLSIRTSFSSTPPQPSAKDPTSPPSTTEPKKYRKRLFSNSSQRPSTSTSVPICSREEDSSSVFSLRSDNDTSRPSHKSWAVTRNYSQDPSSFWDEIPDTTPCSPAPSQADYYPQAIMSRDQLAKLEASVASLAESPQTHEPPFPPSIVATESEEAQDQPDSVALSTTASLQPGRKSLPPSSARLASLKSRSGGLRRPVTADPLMRENKQLEGTAAERALSSDANSTSTASSLDSTTGLASLPPPPRPRLRSTTSIRSTTSMATTITSSIERLNFPKIKERPNTAITTTSPLQLGAPGTGNLRPPLRSFTKSAGAQTRGKARTFGVLEKTIHRRSIMRKSSFLDIDGDADPEPVEVKEKRDSLFLAIKASAGSVSSNGSVAATKTGESFLDFARESFDTIRT